MSGLPAAPIVNAMTIDVEDYFQVSAFERLVSREAWAGYETRVVANTERLLDLFDGAGVRATFFVLAWVAERSPSLIRRIAAAGHEIACHGYSHQLIYLLTPRQFRDDVREAKHALEQIVGRPVVGYRAPSYSVTRSSLWALDVLVEEGYVYDASIFPVHHDRYGIPDAERHPHVIRRPTGSILEIPASTVRVRNVNLPIAGGGYFRLLPYAYTRWGINRVNEIERKPVVFYLHPWEIDADQPRMPVGATTRMRHYGGLGRTETRLRRLLSDFRFDCIESTLAFRPTVAA